MKKFSFWLGKVFAIAFACAGCIFLLGLKRLQMVPADLLIAFGLLLALFVALSAVLTWTGRGKGRMAIGLILAITMTLGLAVGSSYVWKAANMVENIANMETETVHVGIYVRSDDENDYNAVAATYRYGILQTIDRDSTDGALEQMEQTLGTTVTVVEYPSLPALIEALLNKEIDAIVLNQAFLDLLLEMEGYEDILDRIRETELKQVTVEIPKPSVPAVSDKKEENKEDKKQEMASFSVYISGIDTYGSVFARSRSDVNILAVVNPNTRQVALISTPRDYFVPLSISDGIPDKLTHAGIYGVEVSKDTLGMLYGIETDYFFRVNFSGFEEIIDALGGITVYSDYAFTVKSGRYSFDKGENYMTGEAALYFSRERYAFASGDRQRGKNQMAVIKAVIEKMMSSAMLKNYSEVLDAVGDSFETSIPMELVGQLVSMQLKDGGQWNIVTYSVDGTGDSQIPYSMSQYAYVMWPDYDTVDQAKALIQSVVNGEILGQ